MRGAEPSWHNAPVPNFGAADAHLLIVGLAPGLRGANRTGRPFTGDYAGDLLYRTLLALGLAQNAYLGHAQDGLRLDGAMITNAVRCVPPGNKPTTAEIAACRPFLQATIEELTALRVIIALGRIAHDQVIRACGKKPAAHPFAHGASHSLASSRRNLILFDSYHCSRYNTNTGVLTEEMFASVLGEARRCLDARGATLRS